MNVLNYSLDIAFVIVVVLTAVVVARRMLVESALLLLVILLASLASMTVFEPISEFCSRRMFLPSDISLTRYLWFFVAVTVFLFSFALLFKVFFSAFVRPPEFNRRWESVGCWAVGLVAGYLLAAFLLTIVHTLPFSRNFGGVFEPDARERPGPIMALAPDYQFIWLAESVSSVRGLQQNGWQLSSGKARPAGKVPATQRKRLAWFPIRYANWRERLELFDSGEDDPGVEEDSMDERETTEDMQAGQAVVSDK